MNPEENRANQKPSTETTLDLSSLSLPEVSPPITQQLLDIRFESPIDGGYEKNNNSDEKNFKINPILKVSVVPNDAELPELKVISLNDTNNPGSGE